MPWRAFIHSIITEPLRKLNALKISVINGSMVQRFYLLHALAGIYLFEPKNCQDLLAAIQAARLSKKKAQLLQSTRGGVINPAAPVRGMPSATHKPLSCEDPDFNPQNP